MLNLELESQVKSVAFSPDGRRILTASIGRTASVWDADSGERLLTLKGHANEVLCAAFSPVDGRRIVTGSVDGTAKIWKAAADMEHFSLPGHASEISSVAISLDGTRVVTASWDQTAKVWDAITGRELHSLTGHSGQVWSVSISADGRRVVTGSSDQTAKVWDATTGEEEFTIEGHTAGIRSVAFSPEGHWILTGSEDHTASIWDAASRDLVRTLEGHAGPIRAVSFSPDGGRIVTGSADRTSIVWDANTGKPLLTLPGHGDIQLPPYIRNEHRVQARSALQGHSRDVLAVAFSPDGGRIVTGSADRTGIVWDANTGKPLFSLQGHTDAITSVSFSRNANGLRIITGSRDGTVRVWDAASGRRVLTLEEGGDTIRSVAFSLDDQWIIAGSGRQICKVWKAASPRQVTIWRNEEQRATEVQEARQREQAADFERKHARRARDPGAIKDWLVLAPIPFDEGQGAAALDHEQIAEEAQLQPRATKLERVGKLELLWRETRLDDYLIDFKGLLGGERIRWCVGYAVCYIDSQTARNGLLLKALPRN